MSLAIQAFLVGVLMCLSRAADAEPAADLEPAAIVDRYAIELSSHMTRATVRAQLDVADGRITMNSFGADDQVRGWATFVTDISARRRWAQYRARRGA